MTMLLNWTQSIEQAAEVGNNAFASTPSGVTLLF
jgi:hypothetical protein